MFWCFLHMYHLYEFLSTSLKIAVKYTEDKIAHFNRFWVDSPVAVSTFTQLCSRHHCPPPEFFSSFQTETLQIFNVLDYMMSSHRASHGKDNFPSDTYGSYRHRSSWPYPSDTHQSNRRCNLPAPWHSGRCHIHWGCHTLQPATPESYLKNLEGHKQEARYKSSSSRTWLLRL